MDSFKLQALINTGMAWKLEGSVGRAAMAAIKSGQCMLGPTLQHDYWGNTIPARHMVQPGTLGSFQSVVDAYGQDYADQIALVPSELSVSELAPLFD